jgi:predicted permease
MLLPGQVVLLSLSWISTVILGIPIMTSVLGSPTKGEFYGLLAGISSFIFQLPLQLLFLEIYALVKTQSKEEASPSSFTAGVESSSMQMEDATLGTPPSAPKSSKNAFWGIFKRVVQRVLLNPVVLSIIAGLIISLTRFGPKYLRQGSSDYVEELAWLDNTLRWFGACVSPVSLFAMGVWMYGEGRRLLQVGVLQITLSMLSKLVIVPLIMVGLAFAMNLDDEASRAAVLIAVLPISLASFTLGSQYKIVEAYLAANVAVGTLLMLPAVLVLNIAMDTLNLFPVEVAETPSCP